jgi:Trypsin-like peptidase domain
MVVRRLVLAATLLSTAIAAFTLGTIHTRRVDAAITAAYDLKLEALRREFAKSERVDAVVPAGTSGHMARSRDEAAADAKSQARLVNAVKQQLQTEMGLLPVHLLRDRRASFVELYSYDNFGKTNYGTAGYLGHGYFITVKHAVVALKDEDDRQGTRKINAVKIMYQGKELAAKVVDTGDADVEVHSGDWAIIKTREIDLPSLRVDAAFGYDFAEPIFRLGNDYSKGIILSTGYVGQHTTNGLVTCLTDGHPGVSGGGVLNQHGDLVGIPIGRMQGDYRFSFILPIRAEMLRKVPLYEQPEPLQAVVAAENQ